MNKTRKKKKKEAICGCAQAMYVTENAVGIVEKVWAWRQRPLLCFGRGGWQALVEEHTLALALCVLATASAPTLAPG